MENIMGETGAYMLITMVTMALMSTGSGEVMGVSSIIIYDIYKVYINPFRYILSNITIYFIQYTDIFIILGWHVRCNC